MKRNVEIIVLSDLHLGSKTCKAKELLNYLKSVKPHILVLNGNILNPSFLKAMPIEHFKILNRLMKMLSQGTRIYYLTGNSDAAMRRFSDFNNGNLFLRDQLVLDLNHKKYWFFHGDVLETHLPFLQRLSHFLAKPFSLLWTIFSPKKTRIAEKSIQEFEKNAVLYAYTEGYDAVVCGHTHAPKIEQKDNILYLNAGDWTENRTALEYNHGEWSLYRYDPFDYDFINPKLKVKDLSLDEDELKLLLSNKETRDLVLQKPKNYVIVHQKQTEDWIDNGGAWDGIEP